MTAAIRVQFALCRPWLDAALKAGGEATGDELLAELIAGRAQLWPGEGCAVVTQCLMGEDGGTIHAWLGGGILAEMVALRPGIEAWGRSMGCNWATIEGRPGWDRLYASAGYERHGDLLRKNLAGG